MMMDFQQNFFQMNQINLITIYDCFNYYQQVEIIKGENSIYCNKCQCLRNAQLKSFLVTSPKILIIVINRGKGIESNIKLEFEKTLNLQNYVNFNVEKKFNYKLIGLVINNDLREANDHFIAFCKNPIDNYWYKYDDDLVVPITNDIEEVINYALPCILFYQKIG